MPWKTNPYFDKIRPGKHPEISVEQAIQAAENFLREVVQNNGRIRRWGYVEELGKYVRVVIEADGETLHNAFIDGRFRP